MEEEHIWGFTWTGQLVHECRASAGHLDHPAFWNARALSVLRERYGH
ncbi:MAG: hypothetical protein LC799_14030 [Actinobacteria bacterium]|nr:hypothetical protein [Actinomycetota bacterium]